MFLLQCIYLTVRVKAKVKEKEEMETEMETAMGTNTEMEMKTAMGTEREMKSGMERVIAKVKAKEKVNPVVVKEIHVLPIGISTRAQAAASMCQQ